MHMTSGQHKSKDNDAIFEAYTQQQLDERGGFWDKQLANSPVMKKLAGNMSSRAQGRVDSKQTANQITQAFYQSLGRNKGNVDTDQFKVWMGQAVGVDPQYLQSLGNVTKPQMSHGEIKKLIPDVVDQAITAKQSGQAAKPGVGGMSQNTQIAPPQQQTVAPPAGVTPPNPNSQPQQAAVNNPNTPQSQVASPQVDTPAPVENKPGLMGKIGSKLGQAALTGAAAAGGAALGAGKFVKNQVQNVNNQGKQDAQKAIDATNQANTREAEKQAQAQKQQGDYDSIMTPPVNHQDQYDSVMSDPGSNESQNKVEPPAMKDLVNPPVDDSTTAQKNEIEPTVITPPVPQPEDDVEEVDAEPVTPGETVSDVGDGAQTYTVDAQSQNPPPSPPESPDNSSAATRDIDKEKQEIEAKLRAKGYNQQDIERWSDPNNGLTPDQIGKEMQDYKKNVLTPPPPPELTNNSSTTTASAAKEPPVQQNQVQSNTPKQAVHAGMLAELEQEVAEAEDETERAFAQSMLDDFKKKNSIQERINRGRPGFTRWGNFQ